MSNLRDGSQIEVRRSTVLRLNHAGRRQTKVSWAKRGCQRVSAIYSQGVPKHRRKLRFNSAGSTFFIVAVTVA